MCATHPLCIWTFSPVVVVVALTKLDSPRYESRIPRPTPTHTTASKRFDFKTGSVIECVLPALSARYRPPVVFPAFCESVNRNSATVLTGGLIVYLLPPYSPSVDRTVKYRESHSLQCSHNQQSRVRFQSELELHQVKGRVPCQSPSFSQSLRTTIP